MDGMNIDSQEIALETPAEDVFRAPSIYSTNILDGASYAHYSAIPKTIADEMTTECVLGVDEAGRGPVLGICKSQQRQTALFALPAIC
jgi:ribonuclease H2 subunit A